MLLALLCLTWADDDAVLLAPTPQELKAAIETLELRLDYADAAREALAVVHNASAEHAASLGRTPPCDDALAGSLAARSEVLGPAYRDLLQGARAQGTRARRLVQAPTVAVLAEGVMSERLQVVSARQAEHETAYAELSAWQRAELTPWMKRCEPALSPGEGYLGARPVSGEGGRVAVVVMEGGAPSPEGVQLHDAVWLVAKRACWQPKDAESCAPLSVSPGAVLGPAPVPVEEAPSEGAPEDPQG